VGANLKIDFDRVLMAIFLCWTPQSALAAMALTAWWLWAMAKDQSESSESIDEVLA
jgi:hypothetical protein